MTGYRAFNDMNSFWMEHPGVDDDVVISSRVRLARNSPDFPFSGNHYGARRGESFWTEWQPFPIAKRKTVLRILILLIFPWYL